MDVKTLNFIEKAKVLHGDKYDYSKVKYINAKTKVIIICPKHGEFEQTPNNHLSKYECKECGVEKVAKKQAMTKDEFLLRMYRKLKVKNIFSFEDDEIKNQNTKVYVSCSKHGIVESTVQMLLQKTTKFYCSKCGIESRVEQSKQTQDDFIKKAKAIHGDKYDYSKVNYINSQTKVTIICPKHGEFEQTTGHHILRQHGCMRCCVEKRSQNQKMSLEFLIEKFKKNHSIKYDYSKVVHNGWDSNIIIICPKHGEFEQMLSVHINGSNCPKCQISKGEEKILSFLNKKNISFEKEKTAKELFANNLFLLNHERTRFDFFIKKLNLLIEYDGEQHFSFRGNAFGKKEDYFKGIKRDNAKNLLVEQSEYQLLRIPFWEIDNIENILNDLFLPRNKLNQNILNKYTYENNMNEYKKLYKKD